MSNMNFEEIKQSVLYRIMNNSFEVIENTKLSKVAGIYMIYIESFDDENILPIYIGQSDNILRRYSDHFKEILALNRLTKELYEKYHNELFYNGRFKACKIFKYMVDHKCNLSDFHMIILEECDTTELDIIERKYIKEYSSEYFGFNQLESISGQIKNEYRNMSEEDQVKLMIEELSCLEKYLEYGYNKFNYIFAYGMHDQSIEKEPLREIKKRIRVKLLRKESHNSIIEDFNEYLVVKRENQIQAVMKFLVPRIEYIDFPLKSKVKLVPFTKLKKNECGVYFVISNTNRWYGDTCYCAEIVKVVSKNIVDGKEFVKEYLIKNESINQFYFEKDYARPFVFRKNPFQITTNYEFPYIISLTTEFKTGVNDYDFRENPLWNFDDAIRDIIENASEKHVFRLFSNQSKKVMDSCMFGLSFVLEGKLRNEMSRDFNLEGISLLVVNNDYFKGKKYTDFFKEEGIKMRRINDFDRGLKAALKGDYDFIFFKISRSNDKSIKAICEFYEYGIESRIVVINDASIKVPEKISNMQNLEVFHSMVGKNVLKELLL